MKKAALFTVVFLISAGSFLSACGSKKTSADLSGTSWTLVSYGPTGSQTPAAPGIKTSLNFGNDGQVSGNVGCNGFSGSYEVKGGTIVFGPLAATLMACPEPQMTQEGTVFQVMSGTVHFEVAGNTLTIHDASEVNAITFTSIENK
jgi:heat shock protein HslJ